MAWRDFRSIAFALALTRPKMLSGVPTKTGLRFSTVSSAIFVFIWSSSGSFSANEGV